MVFGNPPWSHEERTKLAKDWPTKTSGEIASEFGRSRSAIMGMVKRMNLPSKLPSRAGGRKAKIKPPQIAPQPQENRPPVPVPLLEARDGQCRAIIGSTDAPNGLATVCGDRIVEGQVFSFCANHLAQYIARRGE